MQASIGDLRHRTKEILRALERGEDVSIFSRGRLKGVIKPARTRSRVKVREHPFFGMMSALLGQREALSRDPGTETEGVSAIAAGGRQAVHP
jgi:antitoxin (DNA-binding transcriptional repressor) of toxin-antitoxin stability system